MVDFLLLLAVPAFLLGLAGVFLVLTIRQGRQAFAATRWPTVPGRVLKAGTVEEWLPRTGATVYRPAIAYEYEVAGRRYTGDRLRFGDVDSVHRLDAEALVSRYPVGATVTVAYQPDRPEVATLETRVDWPSIGLRALAMLVCLALALFLLRIFLAPVSPGE